MSDFFIGGDWMGKHKEDSLLLYSERALDTLCLCGIRGRPSQGNLNPIRTYHSLNSSTVTIQRPVFNEMVEDITQADMDILRAVITQYVFEQGYDSTSSDASIQDEDELLLVIAPKISAHCSR